jgi:hypothetical protein
VQGVEENIWLKRDEVTGDWRKLHKEEFHNLYSPNIKSRRVRWMRLVAQIREMRSA